MIIALGIYMLVEGEDEKGEGDRLLALTERGIFGAVALGISISLDELAIGVQAFVVTQIGVRLGGLVGAQAPDAAEKLAGVALLLLGLVLVIERLTT